MAKLTLSETEVLGVGLAIHFTPTVYVDLEYNLS